MPIMDKIKARRKLLALLPRAVLDSMAGNDRRPWNFDRPSLIDLCQTDAVWDGEEVRKAINRLIEKAG